MLTTEHPREQKVLTVSETAIFFKRSTSWVRDEITGGRLKTLYPAGQRPFLVTEASIVVLQQLILDRLRSAVSNRRPALRLVIDNTK